MGGLLQRAVLVDRHQHGVAALGRDLDRNSIIVDLLDEREQVPTRFARRHRHRQLLA